MLEDKSTYGSITTTTNEKIALARKSFEYNMKNKIFRQLFPELEEHYKKHHKPQNNSSITQKDTNSQPTQHQWYYTFGQIVIFVLIFLIIVYLTI